MAKLPTSETRSQPDAQPQPAFSLPPRKSAPGTQGAFFERLPIGERLRLALEHLGGLAILTGRSLKSLTTTPFEFRAFVYQLDQLGVRSLGIAIATAVFVGMVMCIQFALTLEKYGAKDSIGRIVGLSQTRELAPALTALVVGSRVAAGMAAELGSMAVTEQIDAIRALGADPIRKLVVPRLTASVVVMPLLTSFALAFSILGAMVVAALSYGVTPDYFWTSVIDVVHLSDIASGFGKTPFFGFVIAVVGCYFGLLTQGGTEGVGKATTSAVVVVSVSVLLVDALLTKLFISLSL